MPVFMKTQITKQGKEITFVVLHLQPVYFLQKKNCCCCFNRSSSYSLISCDEYVYEIVWVAQLQPIIHHLPNYKSIHRIIKLLMNWI